MNPAARTGGYPAPQQTVKYEGLSGQAGPTTVINIGAEPPRDHIIWSLFSFVYGNAFCLGLAALIYSVKARDRKAAGDLNAARSYASTARCLNIWATVLGCIMLVFVVIMWIFIVFAVLPRASMHVGRMG